jgi:hypothetical protein
MTLQVDEHRDGRMEMTHHKASDHKILPFDDALHTSTVDPTPAAASHRRRLGFAQLASLATLLVAPATRSDDFENLSYDAATDELVVVVNYSGTNPDHQFDLNWGECQTKDDNQHEIAGDLLDQQARDAAHQDYRKTLRFSLANLDCRPATVTLRTAPRYLASVDIPARRSKQ